MAPCRHSYRLSQDFESEHAQLVRFDPGAHARPQPVAHHHVGLPPEQVGEEDLNFRMIEQREVGAGARSISTSTSPSGRASPRASEPNSDSAAIPRARNPASSAFSLATTESRSIVAS